MAVARQLGRSIYPPTWIETAALFYISITYPCFRPWSPPSRETQPAALSGAIRREAEEDRARASQRLGLEHWTRRLVGGHSAQCLSAMTPMAMPRNNKKNAGIQFGSNGTTYLHPVPFPAQKWHKIQTEANANFWTICRSATKHAPIYANGQSSALQRLGGKIRGRPLMFYDLNATLGISILLLTCVGMLYVAARSGLN